MKTILTMMMAGAVLLAQPAAERTGDKQGEKLSIAFRDPSRPGMVKMNLLYGSIVVKAYAGKEVLVEMESRSGSERERELPESAKGLKRLSTGGSSVTLEEENNVVTVSMGWKSRSENVVISVPAKTSLKLGTTSGRLLQVDGVEGEMELNSINGNIVLNDVSGSVVAHALNGKLTAKFKRVDEGKPMSFSSMNGTIDVTLPASVKANLKIQTNNGDVYSDFDVQLKPSAVKVEKVEEGNKERGGRPRNRVRMETATVGTIQGGGPEFSFKNFNGNIYIRKGN
jgi:hypothetical protein